MSVCAGLCCMYVLFLEVLAGTHADGHADGMILILVHILEMVGCLILKEESFL